MKIQLSIAKNPKVPKFEKQEHQTLLSQASMYLTTEDYVTLIDRATIKDLEAALVLEAENRREHHKSDQPGVQGGRNMD